MKCKCGGNIIYLGCPIHENKCSDCEHPEPEASRGEQVIYKGDIKLDSPEGGNPSRVNHRPCKDARNPESLICECGHEQDEHFNHDGGCEKCDCEDYKPSKTEGFCEKCYHNKEAHTFGNCAYCNCKGFEEKKKEGK